MSVIVFYKTVIFEVVKPSSVQLAFPTQFLTQCISPRARKTDRKKELKSNTPLLRFDCMAFRNIPKAYRQLQKSLQPRLFLRVTHLLLTLYVKVL